VNKIEEEVLEIQVRGNYMHYLSRLVSEWTSGILRLLGIVREQCESTITNLK
jgi:hypothetical protein